MYMYRISNIVHDIGCVIVFTNISCFSRSVDTYSLVSYINKLPESAILTALSSIYNSVLPTSTCI